MPSNVPQTPKTTHVRNKSLKATERSERFTIKGQSLLPKSEHPPDSQTWFKGGLQMFGTVWVVFYRGIRLSMPGSK